MVHVRDHLLTNFGEKLELWLRRRSGVDRIDGSVLRIDRITNAEGLKLYLCKGLDPHLARLWNIRPQDCGTVFGRRAGTSRTLGPAEWRPRKDAYRQSRARIAA